MPDELELSPFLLENLACPMCKASPLELEEDGLICPVCATCFPVKEGIPYLLPYYPRHDISPETDEQGKVLQEHLREINLKVESCNEATGAYYDKRWMPYGDPKETIERITAFQELDLHGGECVLDVGAGTLRCGLYAIEEGAKVVCGIDLIPGMLKQGKRKAIDRGLGGKVNIAVADARFIPFRDKTFDRVISIELIEHIAIGADLVFKEVFRVLKPGGKAVVNVWSVRSPLNSKKRQKNSGYFRNNNFYKFYFPKEFSHLFANIDYSKKHLYGCRFLHLYGLLNRAKIPYHLELGLAIEWITRHYFPRLSLLLGSLLMVRLEK